MQPATNGKARQASREDENLSLISSQMMAAQQRPSSRRGASGAWSRLKQLPSDPLQEYGLPSKGETRLNDFKAQEAYFTQITIRYYTWAGMTKGPDDLGDLFQQLAIKDGNQPATFKIPARMRSSPPKDDSSTRSDSAASMAPPPMPTAHPFNAGSNDSLVPELQLIQSAMRKLKEALIASRRIDDFARNAYVFIIRAMIFVKSWESYGPALVYLLRTIHRRVPLAPHELREFATYYVLDLGCRQYELAEAFRAKYAYRIEDRRIDVALRALVEEDALDFWKVKGQVDAYQRNIMSFADEGMRLYALKCIAKVYFTVEKSFVEKVAGGTKWEELVKGGVGWELQEDGVTVVVRRPKARSAPKKEEENNKGDKTQEKK